MYVRVQNNSHCSTVCMLATSSQLSHCLCIHIEGPGYHGTDRHTTDHLSLFYIHFGPLSGMLPQTPHKPTNYDKLEHLQKWQYTYNSYIPPQDTCAPDTPLKTRNSHPRVLASGTAIESQIYLCNVADVRLHLSHVLHLLVQQFQHARGEHVDLVRHACQTLRRIALRVLERLRTLARLDVVSLAVGGQIVKVLMAVPQLFPRLGDAVLEQFRHLLIQLVLRHLCGFGTVINCTTRPDIAIGRIGDDRSIMTKGPLLSMRSKISITMTSLAIAPPNVHAAFITCIAGDPAHSNSPSISRPVRLGP